MELAEIKNLTFRYPDAAQNALDDVSATLYEGEFTVICGESGCGKTTLLKMLKRALCPFGTKTGEVLFCGKPLDSLSERAAACEIGFVMQNPDNQLVTDKVWHELAFGPENMGVENEEIRRITAEAASYFGIAPWYRRDTATLSGGQKQLLNLASVISMNPRLLLLDEPTSQLDPIAASEFIAALKKLNSELGLTIVLVEHRLEEVFPICDRAIVMEKGRIIADGTPREVCARLTETSGKMLAGMPSAVRIYNLLNNVHGVKTTSEPPLTVKECRRLIIQELVCKQAELELTEPPKREKAAAELRGVWFRYEKETPDVLRGTTLDIMSGETLAILGGNGSGKSTLLSVLSGQCRAYKGSVTLSGKPLSKYNGTELYRNNLALLPQNPQTVFLKDSVREELAEVLKAQGADKSQTEAEISRVCNLLGISELLNAHPYDLSGGEQQKAAIAKILLTKPRVLLLDEPTKGLDAYSKGNLLKVLRDLKADGKTVVAVTHDVEFAAECADRCAMLFDGEIISCDIPQRFFGSNNFYTTAAARISRGVFKNAALCDEVARLAAENRSKA